MIQLMVDTHIFEAIVERQNLSGDSLARFIKVNYADIFERNGVSEAQFLRTFDYYEHHPGKMDELMTRVIDELSRMEAEVKGEKLDGRN